MASLSVPRRMRAAQIAEYSKPYELVEKDVPSIRENELLIRVHAAGFCHSDLQVLQGQFKSPLGMIPSHEPAGVIVQVGAGCSTDWKVGDRVGALNFKNSCGECSGCSLTKRTGNELDPRFCDKRETAGFQHDGAFAEYLTIDPETTVRLPPSLPFDQAAPLMCAGATVWGSLERATAGLNPGETVAIVGIGGLGHLGLQFASAMGFRTIAIDSRPAGRQLAVEMPNENLKPALVVDSSVEDATSQILNFTNGEGVAAAVVCTDSLAANNWALTILRIGGVMGVLGLPAENWRFDSSVIVFKELTIRGSYVAVDYDYNAPAIGIFRIVELGSTGVPDSCFTSSLPLYPINPIAFSNITPRRDRWSRGWRGQFPIAPTIVDFILDNPVQQGDVEKLLQPLGLTVKPEESADYQRLLAAVHDCATRIDSLPDYQPVPDTKKYPRENIHLPTVEEQEFGHAWAHRFIIRGDQSAKDPSSGSLKGMTVCLKDCIAVAGVPQFYGSDAFEPWIPSTDATVVTRVLDAGADILGTATCEHFCNSTASFTSAQGTIENPYKEGYSTGGSTSGGAALVGSGKIDIAIGTDQGGSIRVPSAFCGCVGVKPTHGLIPFTGFTSGDPIDDHAGPICRSVMEAARCLDVLAGYDGIDDKSLGAAAHGSYNFTKTLRSSQGRLDGVKIGILKEGFYQEIVDPRVRDHVLAAARKLETLGASIEEVSVPLHLEGPSIWTIQQRISGSSGILGRSSGHRGLGLTEFEKARLPFTDPSFQKLFPSTKNTVINGLYLADKFPGLYSKTVNIGRQISDAYQQAFEKYDAIIMPTTPFVAPRHGSRASVLGSFEPTIGLTTNTAIFNVTGHPAMSIPVGFIPAADDEGVMLPVGMQIVGGLWQEKKVLNVGHAWESNFQWRDIKAGEQSSQIAHGSAKNGTSVKANGRPMTEVNGTKSPTLKRVKLSA
ncbi:amidase [Colletotrichum karsti]|uniref:Amidase n=1 Tax=Colletotrichum karsti TaxID=1095194 RepID=A0A9P6I3S7_9PEZI|nr:amidase [Colletotrichum karsti]KAF9875242.1 amidase [Colletotrichum karsti]